MLRSTYKHTLSWPPPKDWRIMERPEARDCKGKRYLWGKIVNRRRIKGGYMEK